MFGTVQKVLPHRAKYVPPCAFHHQTCSWPGTCLVVECATDREFDHLLVTRDVSHLCHAFSRRDIIFCLRREKPVLQEGIICFNRLSYGIFCRQAARKKPSFQVILVALAFWKDGRREVLDWSIAPTEEHTHWEVLLNQLFKRGVEPEKGRKMIVRDGCGGREEAVAHVYGPCVLDQRCVFHKLHNVGAKARSELKGNEQREERKQLMQEASEIYHAETASQARQRFQVWTRRWQGCAPDTVATRIRDFEATLVFYQLDTLTREWIRTTSLLERANRAFRSKFRQAVTFGSQIGAEVALYLQVLRLYTQ